jgi:hypothetical protein
VMTLLREVGCKVSNVKSHPAGPALTATLLAGSSTSLADALPVIKRKIGGRR